MIHPESAVQRGVKRGVPRAVAVDHEFACHDRGAEHNAGSHIYEEQRGYRRAWLDTELVLAGGWTWRCELKRPGWKPPSLAAKSDSAVHWRDQEKMIGRLIKLGHPAAWAASVTQYFEEAYRAGVPLHPNWRLVAAHEDELVAADIRKQIAREEARAAGHVSKAPKAKVSAARLRALEAVRARVMF